MKFIAGLIFILAIPLLCMLLLWHAYKSKRKYKLGSRVLLYIGLVMSCLTLFTYIPTIVSALSAERMSFFNEIIGFLIWFIPSFSMLLTGWLLQKRSRET